MTYKSRIIKKLKIAKNTKKTVDHDTGSIADMMADPRYLRQSSALINEALQKGFDVLQLSDGSIVTTGTKTVVYQYSWDGEKGKLVRTKSESSSTPRPKAQPMITEEDDRDHENEHEIEAEDA